MNEVPSGGLFALSAAILALGIVYWLVRNQDRHPPSTHANDVAYPVDEQTP